MTRRVPIDAAAVYEMRQNGASWQDIFDAHPDNHPESVRNAFSRYRRQQEGPPQPRVTGVMAEERVVDEDEVWEAAVKRSRKLKGLMTRKKEQAIGFDSGPVCIVNMADIHAGGIGVDYDRLSADLDLINRTPGMFIGLAGDMLDNFVIGKLATLNVNREFSVTQEWALVRRVLRLAAPKLIWAVSGNHDKWTSALTGIDYFREVLAERRDHVLYDTDDLVVRVTVGEHEFGWRIRHKWRGSSIYSPTHAIERAAKFDKGVAFDVGIGAHTHEAGVARFFNNGGRTGLAVLCGAYKRHDDHAVTNGFPQPNEITAVPVILTERGGIITTNSLEEAADYMEMAYRGDDD